jgi:DNA anti-recombination protein RmuC
VDNREILERSGFLTLRVNTQIAAANDQMFKQQSNQFSESQKLVTDVRDAVNNQLTELANRVGQTQQATQQVFNLADQLKNLERVLTSRKQRGNLGEAGLVLVLGEYAAPIGLQVAVSVRERRSGRCGHHDAGWPGHPHRCQVPA